MRLLFICLVLSIVLAACHHPEQRAIKIGLNVELTGENPAIGASSKNAATLFVEQLNSAGGIRVGDEQLPIELIVRDNGGKGEQAVSAAHKLIGQEKVLAMVGPNMSACAIPAAEIAENSRCPMISPWSTNPKTTQTVRGAPKKYIFRAGFTEALEALALTKFALDHLNAKRVAILYDVSSESPHTISTLFRQRFEGKGGTITAFETYTTGRGKIHWSTRQGTITTFETYTAGDRDFSAQLTKIKATQPDLIFLPAYYNDVALITRQARQLGLHQTFLGFNSWGTPEIVALAGKNVEGAYFSNHFSPTQISTPFSQKFITDYHTKFGKNPDDIAALTYDSFQLLAKAIEIAGKQNRTAVRDAFFKIKNYQGLTGAIQYTPGSGDPSKTIVILRIQDGKFVWVANAEP